MKRTLQSILDAHRRRLRALDIADAALREIKQVKHRAISINVFYPAKDFHGTHIPPLKKNELRLFENRSHALTHEQIDKICNDYIRLARRAGVWCFYHNPIEGRLDDVGVFHPLGSDSCPKSGDICLDHAGVRSKFDRSSLAEYRKRVAGYHAKLDEHIAEVDRQNEENGWKAAADKRFSAMLAENAAWEAILERVTSGSIADVAAICSYQRARYQLAFRRWRGSGRTFVELEAEEAGRGQDIIFMVAKRSAKKGGAK